MVAVGKSRKTSDQTSPAGFRIILLQTDTKNLVRYRIYSDTTAIAGIPVSIFAPDGWKKTLETNQQGEIEFTIPGAGEYLIETYKVIDVDGQDFNKKSIIATTLLDYK